MNGAQPTESHLLPEEGQDEFGREDLCTKRVFTPVSPAPCLLVISASMNVQKSCKVHTDELKTAKSS